MQIKMLKDSALVKLKNDISKNKSNYSIACKWIDNYFKEIGFDDYIISTNIYVDDFELIIGDQNFDAKNAVILHKAMKNLLPIQAREEKLWSYLTHTKYLNYMVNRWPLKDEIDNEKNNSRIESRYFFQGKTENKIKVGTVPYVRNGLSRLWWAGYIVYNEEFDNPYEYINELFISQDMFVGLCERDIAKNKKLVIAILKAIRKFSIKKIPNNTILVRDILKDVNMSAGLIMFDALDEKNIELAIDKIFMKHLEANERSAQI